MPGNTRRTRSRPCIVARSARTCWLRRLRAGARLPTHRELADRLGVTVGTITRGYAEAARRGLVSGEVGRGSFVRGPAELLGSNLREAEDGYTWPLFAQFAEVQPILWGEIEKVLSNQISAQEGLDYAAEQAIQIFERDGLI